MFFNDTHKEKRIIPFGKFRLDYKPFTGAIKSPSYKEIKEDVVELVTLVYDSKYRTIAMEYNLYGAKKKLIEQYFSSFLPQTENENWEVKMEEIISTFNEKELESTVQIKDIEISINFSKNQKEYIKEGISIKNNCLLNSFGMLENISDDYSANIIRLKIGALQDRKASIKKETLLFFLKTLNIDSDCIEFIRIRYKNSKQEMETVDLKNINTVLKVRVLEDIQDKNPAPEFLGNAIIEIFENHSSLLLNSYIKFMKNSCEINIMPKIFKIPKDINQI